MTKKKETVKPSLEQQKLDVEFAMARSARMTSLLCAVQDKPALVLTETTTTTKSYSSPFGAAVLGALLTDCQPKDCQNCDKSGWMREWLPNAIGTASELIANMMAAKMQAETVPPETKKSDA